MRPVPLVVAVAGVVALSLLVVPTVVGTTVSGDTVRRAMRFATAMSTAAFFGAGVLQIARWRLTGETARAYTGVALTIYGGLGLPLSMAAVAIHRANPALALSPWTQLATTSVAIGLLAAARRVPAQYAAVQPQTLAVSLVAWCLGGALVLVVLHEGFGTPLDPPPGVMLVTEVAMAVAWFGVAVATLAAAPARPAASRAWAAAGMALLGLAGLLRAASVAHLAPWYVSAVLVTAAAAGVAVVNASADLLEAYAAEGERLRSLAGALAASEQLRGATERRRREVVHDARNAIAAVQVASATLARYGESLDERTRRELRAAVLGEIGRLELLIDPPRQPAVGVDAVEADGRPGCGRAS